MHHNILSCQKNFVTLYTSCKKQGLAMTEITIGRDGQTGKLRMTVGKQTSTFGEAGSVPRSVSQEHVRVTIGDDGSLVLTNLNPENDTYVNHRAVERKRISEGDRIVLGGEHYRLSWDMLKPFIPKMVDISALEQMWKDYQEQRLQMQIRERRFNTLRSATGLITMAAIALSIMTGRQSLWFIVLYVVAILISLAFTIKAWRDASAVPQKAQQLNRQFQHDYVCPQCGHFLGNQPYELLAQNGHCPYCKTQFIL